ncbi:hypothetical protein GQ53DRAFT_668728, partial [Thozetella sp. PMI_491]
MYRTSGTHSQITERKAHVGIAHVYCNYRWKHIQNARELLASLLAQLCDSLSPFPECVGDLSIAFLGYSIAPPFESIWKALQKVATRFSRVFVVIDGLDESSPEVREALLDALAHLQKLEDVHLNIFATSSPEIVPHFADQFPGCLLTEVRVTEDEILTYINSRLHTVRRPCLSNFPRLKDEIRSQIIKCANGRFLAAKLLLDHIFSKPTAGDIRDALEEMGPEASDLDSLYSLAMERIDGQESRIRETAIKALYWTLHSKRQLTTTELQYAVAVRAKSLKLEPEYLSQLDHLVSDCAGLLVIDEASNTVRLMHHTAEKYLQQTQHEWFPNANAEIAATCINYLSFCEFEDGPCVPHSDFKERLQQNPLYDYAARHWGQH